MIFLITRGKRWKSMLKMQKVLQIGCYKTSWTMVLKIHMLMEEKGHISTLRLDLEKGTFKFTPWF
jgi:hypothetical protein